MTNRLRLLLCAVALFLTACTPAQLARWAELDPGERHDIVEHVIRDAAAEFGVPGDLMVAIARCESGLRPEAKSPLSSAAGPFQFLDTTWERARFRLYDEGIDAEPYAPEDRWLPIPSARIAAHVVSQGGISWWSESRHCWGSVQ